MNQEPQYLTDSPACSALHTATAPQPSADQNAGWQAAQERALLYLKMLGIEPLMELDLTRQALHEAKKSGPPGIKEDETVRLVMKSLRRIIANEPNLQQRIDAPHLTLYSRWHTRDQSACSCSATKRFLKDQLLPFPPINRGNMKTRKI